MAKKETERLVLDRMSGSGIKNFPGAKEGEKFVSAHEALKFNSGFPYCSESIIIGSTGRRVDPKGRSY